MRDSIVVTTLVLMTGGAAAAQDATVTGTFTVKNKAVRFANVYAMADMDWYGKGKDLRVVLSDVKLTPEQLEGPFGLQRLMKADQVHAIVATLNPKGDVLSIQMYDAAFNMDSVSTAGTNNKFEGQMTPASVEGKLFTVKADTFDKVAYEFSATFKTSIARKAVETTAAKSAPRSPEQQAVLKAAQAYMKAAAAGDVPGLKAAVTADAASDLDGADGKQIVEMLKALTPANPTTGPIEVKGDTATITFEERDQNSTSTSTVRLKKVNGAWKVNPKGGE